MTDRPSASDAETRKRMRRQKQRATKPELTVRKLVTELGHRYRTNASTIPGSPDLSNKSRGWAIFVHGCYWHHHEGCSKATLPKRNREWWVAKFARNAARDQRKIDAVEQAGMAVTVVWECECRDLAGLRERLSAVLGPAPRASRQAR